jgi:hypothetical protein
LSQAVNNLVNEYKYGTLVKYRTWENCGATSSTTNPVSTALGSNLGMHSTNVVSDDLSYGTAFKQLAK